MFSSSKLSHVNEQVLVCWGFFKLGRKMFEDSGLGKNQNFCRNILIPVQHNRIVYSLVMKYFTSAIRKCHGKYLDDFSKFPEKK